MSVLVDEFKNEHKWLVAKLMEVNKQLGTSKAASTLNDARKGLLAHLKKEDNKLYPTLQEAAKDDEKIAHLYRTFSEEMNEISAAALAFFEKYASDAQATATPAFKRDFDGLLSTLAKRVGAEETLLYPAFAKLEAKWGVNLSDGQSIIPVEPAAAANMSTAMMGRYVAIGAAGIGIGMVLMRLMS